MSRSGAVSIFSGLSRPLKRRAVCQCASELHSRPSQVSQSRSLATSTRNLYEPQAYADPPNDRPRWQAPPPRMTAPFRSKPAVDGPKYPVNEDPEKLDRAYERTLGTDGHKLLTEEVKWLAVTHKSFDHGRRGYNDRLAFLGRRIVELQTSLALVHGSSSAPKVPVDDQFEREPFQHPALKGLDGLYAGEKAKDYFLEKKRLAKLAESYGLDGVVRWKPKNARNRAALQASGQPVVLQQTIYAIIGAVAFQKGAIVANDIVRERILGPLGLW